ncbi:MAG: hypothetical protein IJS15_13210 [Victivallales bacterium]|nr:hypothetical protein [Victivallales bacterium]
MYNGHVSCELHIPKKEYIPTEEEIYADGYDEKTFAEMILDDHCWVPYPLGPVEGEDEDEVDRRNAILQEQWKRATGDYWAGNKYARLNPALLQKK